ncbi:hypothetical protein [Macrococcus bovicus]|uniref:Replicative helicase inhibitor G39P N-terminal domain-containing protein n=1 Tax=Macrococcus bovicus TaxID=69968 RepID=A0A4R6C379_9STAP|nr:hypothetical protein [Macrococcus bovicus]TDM15613.1 hypothetical protein ERX55_01525 [Macrococcus bovicus]
MTDKEAASIVQRVQSLYPNFKLNREIGQAWLDALRTADYERTNNRLSEYYRQVRFAPHISDIAMYEQINEAQRQYEAIQRDIEANRNKPKDPEKQARIQARYARLKEYLNDDE